MRLFSIMIFVWRGQSATNANAKANGLRLAESMDLSEYGFFKKTAVKEVLTFVSRSVVDRSSPGEKSSVAHEDYVAHVRVNADADKLACVVITDKEYPSRVAFDIIQQSLTAFKLAAKDWQSISAVADADMLTAVPLLNSLLQQYQRPQEVDKLMKIQKDVDDTKAIMLKNFEDVLERNEKLDDLIRKSNDLSIQSKTFARDSKKLNSCCR